MLLYEAYRWFRQRRRGSLERERQRACAVLVVFAAAIVIGSGGLGAINRALAGYVHTPGQASLAASPLQAR